MTDIREMMEKAMEELAEDEKDPKYLAIKEIIRVERRHYYSAKGSAGRLREVRDIVSKYSSEEEVGDADK